jgi:asparagine synthase (glutamine-hydrolysing)
MCGIAGAVWFDPAKAVDDATLRRMTTILRHRGPDDEGFFSDAHSVGSPQGSIPGVALGHRRLSVIDLQAGHQPMTNEDGSIQLIFNGEIYNYQDLRRRLEGAGHTFRTDCDTETIVHLYEDRGVEFVEHLNGMFALAIWDARHRRLVLARDRLGKKPLVYRWESNRLLFASELKSILQVPGVPRQLDAQALDEFLTYQYVPHPLTIFKGISKLPPGHVGVYADGKLALRRYWEPNFAVEKQRPTAEYIEELRSLLTSAVAMRLRSDVPLGAFLSGGVDSSLMVALAQAQLSRPIKTFSIGFSDGQYDETRYARMVAERLRTEHHEFRVEPRAVDILPRLIWHFDEPFADSSALPTWYVSELTRQHVTVALTGDGGDELFAGYDRYRAVRLAAWFDRLPSPMKSIVANRLWKGIGGGRGQKSWMRRLGRFAEVLALPPQRRYLEWICIFNEARRAQLYTDDFVASLPDSDPFNFLAAAFHRAGSRDLVTATSLADLTTYLPCDLLAKVDIASMAHGLECRQPLLDYRVVELAAQMPLELKLRGRQSKWILKHAFRDLLPSEIVRRRKMGFGVPLEKWFRTDLHDFARDVLLAPHSLARGYFRPETVRQYLDDHQSGKFNHAHRLWALIVLELWCREWLDSEHHGGP